MSTAASRKGRQMNIPEKYAIGHGFVTDIAVNHMETLYTSATPTLGALTDLLEFAQASLLNEQITVSPLAYKYSSFLRELEWVHAPEIRITEKADEEGRDSSEPTVVSEESSVGVIEVDGDEAGLFGRDPTAEMILGMAFSELLQDDPILGCMTNPRLLRPAPDLGVFYRGKLPAVMFLLQISRQIIRFEDAASRDDTSQRLQATLELYRKMSRHLRAMQFDWGMDVVPSVLEQPLLGSLLVDVTTEPVERLQKAMGGRLEATAMAAPGRARFFEKLRLPPLGLVAVSEADSLEKVAATLRKNREKFADFRLGLRKRSETRAELVKAAEGFSAEAEQAGRELDQLDAETRRIGEAFDEELQNRRPVFRRTELVFKTLDYVLETAAGLGFGTVAKLCEHFGFKRRAILQEIPGLFKAASFIADSDSARYCPLVEKMLRRPMRAVQSEAAKLRLAFEHATAYAEVPKAEVPEAMTALKIRSDEGESDVSDRDFWRLLVSDEEFRGAMEQILGANGESSDRAGGRRLH